MAGRYTVLRSLAVAGLALALVAPADARPGGGSGSGSRGSRTWSAPPSTATAPRTAQPMQRTETQAASPARPGMAPAAQPGRFGFGSGLMAGLLGAGLLGMLFGGGFFGGLSGLGSILGLLLQVGLVVGVVMLALRFFRRRSEPALAGAAGTHARSALGPNPVGGGSAPNAAASGTVTVGPADYEAFERSLCEIQTAYGREDMAALDRLATSEMVRYFGADLEENRRKGLHNEVSAPRLLQGDLSEAWREGSTAYATVAMRFSVVDATVERGSGRVVDGDRQRPQESTELWTFRRDLRGGGWGPWLLSAIQQTR